MIFPFITCAVIQALISVILSVANRAPEANTMLLWALLNLNGFMAYQLYRIRNRDL